MPGNQEENIMIEVYYAEDDGNDWQVCKRIFGTAELQSSRFLIELRMSRKR